MLNRDLKSLLSFWENLARNLRYSALVEPRDILEVQTRVANEGLPFLTVALPELGKALDTFHSTQEWSPCPSFKTDAMGLPYFLGKAIESALEGNSVAVDCVRQLSYVFYKLEVEYGDSTEREFLENFIKSDRDLSAIDYTSDTEWAYSTTNNGCGHSFARCSTVALVNEMARLIGRVLCNSNPRDIRPCHGTGVTSCRTPNHMKWSTIQYYEPIDTTFGYTDLFFYNQTHLSDELHRLEESLHILPRARVCLVPKDSRGPRVISCEPAALMYVQQGLMRKLYSLLETSHITRGQINFIDQGVNQGLAYQGSLNDNLATIDLSDASDRVSLNLIRRVFPSDWVECLEACRSEETILPNGVVVKLNKFAPMGSACCFPVEALVFWACAQATTRLLFGLNRPVYVYGDDIICDASFARGIMVGLESVGLKVNRNKTYVSGPFRESCGGDFHRGMDVTPIRVRKMFTSSGTGLDTCADLLNECIDKFGYESSHSIVRLIEEVVGFVYPRTELPLPVTIRATPSASNDVFFKSRFNKDLQRIEHRTLTSTAKCSHSRPPDWWELLRKELARDKSQGFPYEHPFSVMEAHMDPGSYVDYHSTHKKWSWTWLG
jgi:hypothetical protein